jgi:hypothetical protein
MVHKIPTILGTKWQAIDYTVVHIAGPPTRVCGCASSHHVMKDLSTEMSGMKRGAHPSRIYYWGGQEAAGVFMVRTNT